MQQAILHKITFEDMENAERLLDVYREEEHSKVKYLREETDAEPINNRLERQFYLSMLVQIRCYQEKRIFHDNCESLREEISALLREAISLTIPALEEKKLPAVRLKYEN